MTTDLHRDETLGAALLALPIPEHRPDALAELERALRAPAAAPARRRRRGLRLALVGTAVAVGAAVVGLVVVDRGVGPVAPPETASAASVSSEMRAAFARVRTLRFELREVVQDADGARAVWRYSVALDASGSYRVLSRRDSRTEVYDAARGTLRTLQRGPDAGTSELRGLAPGRPDPTAESEALDRTLGSAIRAIASARPSAVEETTYAGRPVWRIDTPIRPDLVGGDAAPDRLFAIVDRATRFPILLRLTRRGALRRESTITDLAVDARLPAGTFTLPFPAGSRPYVTDAGFRPTTIAGARSRVRYAPLVPATLPSGFRLARVAVTRTPTPTGSEGANPAVGRVVSQLYRRGLDRIVITTRPIGRDRGAWSDPLATGEGFVDRPARVRIRTGALAGRTAELLVDPLVVPHLWVMTRRLVVTVSGDLTRAELLAVAGSLRAAR